MAARTLRTHCLVLLFGGCASVAVATGQGPPSQRQAAGLDAAMVAPVGIIDFFGLERLSPSQLRPALTFTEGDAVTFNARPAFQDESERRLEAIPGVAAARLNFVCCDDGRFIVYVGIEETGAPQVAFRAAPAESLRLDAAVVGAGDDFARAMTSAVQRGQSQEDGRDGHALAADPAARAVQERFIDIARTGVPHLRRVLHESAEARHRAIAAQVLAYAADKGAVVEDLVHAASDPDPEVRNNAIRALWVLAQAPPRPDRDRIQVPFEPFVTLLRSPVWSDRNKASLALLALTADRNPALLGLLRARALPALVEMARWKSRGHAQAGFLIVARIAGYSDEEAARVFARDDRENIIRAVLP